MYSKFQNGGSCGQQLSQGFSMKTPIMDILFGLNISSRSQSSVMPCFLPIYRLAVVSTVCAGYEGGRIAARFTVAKFLRQLGQGIK